jgi:hypothetical protein
MKKYESFEYLYPPRPDNAIAIDFIDWYEKNGYVAQFKKNGTCTIIAISPEKEFKTMNRHNADHKAWDLTDYIKQELVRLYPEKCWIVLVAEIMHSKTKTIKDTIFVHDILVFANNYLTGVTFEDRQKILEAHMIPIAEAPTHFICDVEGKVWFAKCFKGNFKDLFWGIKDINIDEGLVLKDPKAKLIACYKASSNSSWQVKVRHASKKYLF